MSADNTVFVARDTEAVPEEPNGSECETARFVMERLMYTDCILSKMSGMPNGIYVCQSPKTPDINTDGELSNLDPANSSACAPLSPPSSGVIEECTNKKECDHFDRLTSSAFSEQSKIKTYLNQTESEAASSLNVNIGEFNENRETGSLKGQNDVTVQQTNDSSGKFSLEVATVSSSATVVTTVHAGSCPAPTTSGSHASYTTNENEVVRAFQQCHVGDHQLVSKISYIAYESELQMPDIIRLITKDLSEPYSIYTYRYFIHNWPKLCFLAMDSDKCVGAIVCKLDVHKKMARRGYIAMLAVDDEYRRRKIGSNLVLRAIRAMVADDCDEVVLETEVTNKPALHLYENLGFVRDKRLFRYYLNGVDAFRLKLWLR